MYLKPKKLQPGDTIAVVAPGSPVAEERLYRGVQYLERCGYDVRVAGHTCDQTGYLAGTDEARVADLHSMFEDEGVAAILCARGGYGTPRLLDKIDYDLIRRNPKIFVGYSDITAIQLAFLAKSNLITFSGPMVAVEMAGEVDSFTAGHLWNLLAGSANATKLIGEKDGFKCIKPGKTQGTLIGGCLSLVCSLIGTPYLPDFKGSVLFLEEVGEEPYRIDRLLNQLRLSGITNKLSGIIFGRFEECVPSKPAQTFSLEEIFRDLTSDLDIPIVSGLPYGHIDRKYTVPVGVEVELDADKGYIKMDTPVTSLNQKIIA